MKKAFWKTLAVLAGVAGALVGLAFVVFEVVKVGEVRTPRVEVVERAYRDELDQGWKPGWGIDPLNQTQWFHHANQGTRILPYAWFLALERPELSPFRARGRVAEGNYLQRFGFLASEPHKKLNPDNLPVGFAVQDNFVDPKDPRRKETRVVGLTCAACHTGEIHYEDPKTGGLRAARIEGGPAMINIGAFQEAIGKALFFTDVFPTWFDRFANRVLGKDASQRAREELRVELSRFLKTSLLSKEYAEKKGLNKLTLGFARTDALGLIGNRVFGPLTNDNLTVADAPVNFPHLWDTAWFDWVQYNASIRMPMVRNIGEALGVGALVNLDVADKMQRYPSSVNVMNLHRMETQLGGNAPFEGLRSPRWEETRLPAIDVQKSTRGKGLYRQFCQRCHLPPMEELKADLERKAPHFWCVDGVRKKDGKKTWVLALETTDLQVIGTDPNQALNFYRRLALVGQDTVSASKGLYNVTGFIRKTFYESNTFNEDQIFEFDRGRDFDDPAFARGEFDLKDLGTIDKTIDSRLAYKARPLNGIWATAPFFHNGSVPNLYEVLIPAKEREERFYLGTKRFDPVRVGFKPGKFTGGFELNTRLSGNHNSGHEFRNLTLGELEGTLKIEAPSPLVASEDARWAAALGVSMVDWQALGNAERLGKVRESTATLIRELGFVVKGLLGAELTETERWELVEYLKSL